MRRAFLILGLIALALGAVGGGLMCSIALDHNPQGEFYSPETGYAWDSLGLLFGAWMIVTAGVAFLCGVPLAALACLTLTAVRRR